MKAILEFNLPEDKENFDLANNALNYYSALFEFDQCDPKMLDKLPMLDFVTEDASHDMVKSIKTFELLESKLNPGAVYVIEDIYPNFYDSYVKDGRFEMIDIRDMKGRSDDILAVYYNKNY